MLTARDEVTLPAGFVHDLARADTLTDILRATANWIPAIIDAERCSVALPVAGERLQIYALGEKLVMAEQSLLSLGHSLVGQAFESGQVVNISDLMSFDAEEVPHLTKAGLRSALVCPMVSGGRSLGTINLGNATVDHFTVADEVLLRSIADLIASFISVHQLAAAEQALARTDALTGCLNRRAILEHLTKCFEVDRATPSLLYLDIDHFKMINDTHGHVHGDAMLCTLSRRIKGVIGEADVLGRLGGDEFLVVVRSDAQGHAAYRLAERISDVCSMPISIRSVRAVAPLSIGVASAESSTSSSADLLHDADQAMYTAKGSGRPIAVADEKIRARSIMIAGIDRDLDLGMKSGAITYHYQPVRELATRQIVGAEALIRWHHPELGPIPPPLLIDRLEAAGRTEIFTRWSLRAIATQWQDARRQLPSLMAAQVSVNLMPRQLAWQGYADFHLELLDEFEFLPRHIIVEVVESDEVCPGDEAQKTLQRLCDADVEIALDDFGTGHNALAYFTMFPIHSIKFDRSLVGMMDRSDNARRILAGLAAMAKDLGVTSLAEGVETETEAQLCQAAEISLGQGWHFGRPKPLEEFINLAQLEGASHSA